MISQTLTSLSCWCRALVLLAISVVALGGCSTTGGGQHFRMTPLPEDDVFLEMRQQGPILISIKPNMQISVQPLTPLWGSSDRPGFHLFVANLSDYPFAFGMNNIRALYNGQVLSVVSPEVLVVEARQKQEAAANKAATFRFLSVVTNQITANKGIGNFADFAIAQQQAKIGDMLVDDAVQQEMNATKKAAMAEGDYLKDMLKEQVIPPEGQGDGRNIGGGEFYIDIPSQIDQTGYFDILIDVGGEFHDFRFRAQRVEA